MKFLFAAALVATAFAGFTEAANAAGGCGPGWYRGAYGGCRPMRGPVVVAPGAVMVPPGAVMVAPPVVVARPRVCPYGLRWYYGRCRPI